MKLMIEPQYQDYFYPKLSKRPWGHTQYIGGQRRTTASKADKHGKGNSLKGLIITLSILVLAIISRDNLASTPPTSGEFQLIDSSGHIEQAVHITSEAEIRISGLHSRVTLKQTFTNQTDQWVEGIYVFPLPTDCAVNAMTMVIGERVIKAEIRERAQAKKMYAQAKTEGKKAALIEQQRPNMFTQSVANIGPGETIQISLNYLQPIQYDMGKMSTRLPMTMTTRYIPESRIVSPGSTSNNGDIDEHISFSLDSFGWATDEIADTSQITPPQTLHNNQMTLSIQLNAGMKLALIESASHNLNTVNNYDGSYDITTQSSTVAMDKDFELTWYPLPSKIPRAAAFHEQMDGESYIQLMLLPPHAELDNELSQGLNETPSKSPSSAKLSRELILVVDTSGSMQGQSIVQAKKSVEFALSRLQSTDYFNIVAFSSSHQTLFSEARPADQWNVKDAVTFVGNLHANGGTNMRPALEKALSNPSNRELLRQIVFITDGAVGNEQGLFQLINQNLSNSRLFTVGIGSAPNSHFMEKAAQFGKGSFTHISTENQVDQGMNELFKKLENPVMSGVDIIWPSGWEVDAYPNKIPDLYLGEPLLVTAKVSPAMTGTESVVINGKTLNAQWQRELNLPKPKTIGSASSFSSPPNTDEPSAAVIPSLWARLKIDDYIDKSVLGESAQSVRNNILPLALKHQLLSPYTSFIAIEQIISRSPEEVLSQKKIANTKPAGQTLRKVPYPKTATSAKVSLLTGLFTLFLALLVYYRLPKNALPILHKETYDK